MTRRPILFLLAAAMAVLAVTPAEGTPRVAGRRPVRAVPDWYPQFLSGAKNRVNPDETILSPANVSGLTRLWTTGEPVGGPFASPVVSRGVLFEGEYSGTVQALEAATGQVIWTYQDGAPVVASAALAQRTLFVGDYVGTLSALDSETGTLRWQGSLPGEQFFDPDNVTVSHGIVYAATLIEPAGFNPGEVAAWNAAGCGRSTCAPLWTANVDTVEAGPAVSGTTMFVASKGILYAFDTSGCSTPPCDPLWTGTFSASGASAYGSLAISNGIVYVGTDHAGQVNAFPVSGCGAATCLPMWEYDSGMTGGRGWL